MSLQLVRHYLRDTRLRVREASTVDEAEPLAHDAALVLCDIHLDGENGGDLVRRLFESPGSSPPVVMMSADQGKDTRVLVRHPGIDGFIAKPFSQELLLRTVTEFLRDTDESAAPASTGFRVDPQVAEALLPELIKCAEQLTAAASEGNDAVRGILLKMSGVAPVLGLSDLAMRLESLAAACEAQNEIEDLHDKLAAIVSICARAAERG
jgi:DNA-binding response OmpR family regulator